MKLVKLTILIVFVSHSFFSCHAQNSKVSGSTEATSENIEVYYFHFTSRCVTCNAVESETKKVIETFYADEMKEGKIEFKSVNLDESEGKNLAKSLRVSGQTLLLVKGKKRVDLTSQGFMNARTNPEKFQKVLQNNFDKLL